MARVSWPKSGDEKIMDFSETADPTAAAAIMHRRQNQVLHHMTPRGMTTGKRKGPSVYWFHMHIKTKHNVHGHVHRGEERPVSVMVPRALLVRAAKSVDP